MKKIIGFLFICFSSFSVFAQEEDMNRLVQEGNALYQISEYNQAIQKYEEVLKKGYEAHELYYNLGNSYFRLNEYHLAILNYERALRLSPKDKEIQMNLEIANSRIEDKIETVPKVFFVKWIKNLSNVFLPTTWGILTIALLVFTCVFAFFYFKSSSFRMKRGSFYFGILFLLLFLCSFGLGNQRYHSIHSKSDAIVFQPLVVAKSSPQSASVEKFVIHRGAKVHIQEKVNGWIKIRLANGNVGWIEESKVEII